MSGEHRVPEHVAPRAIVVMGVSGSGKSTLGRSLADALGRRFVEGDGLHSDASRAKMAAGIALDDEDRWPFLDRVAQAISDAPPFTVVVACSALKRSYRDFLRSRTGELTFVLPAVGREELSRRVARRQGHFMPASLLDSQLATLETPSPEERAIVVDGTASPGVQLARVLSALRRAISA